MNSFASLVLIGQSVTPPDASANPWQGPLTLVTSLITLGAAVFGFIKARHELAEQKKLLQDQKRDLDKFANAFSDLQALRTALNKPLEGRWDVLLHYEKFHGQTDERYVLKGVAVFTWRGSKRRGYEILLGAHVTKARSLDQLVSMVCQFNLTTDESGMPADNFSLDDGEYLSRVACLPLSSFPFLADPIEYKEGSMVKDQDKNVITLNLRFTGKNSAGPVTLRKRS